MKHRKTQLAAAVGAALLVGATAVQAQAPAASPASLTVQLYGQVNRALMWADDGHQNKIFHVDGQPSSTRFGIQGTSQIAPGLRAGARIETEMKSNPANAVNFGLSPTPAEAGEGASQTNTFAERWLDAFFEGAWGRVNLGQGSGAADDASTIDLSGTSIANGVCFCDWGGAIQWRTAAGGLIPATVEGTHNNQDFESRYDRVMYTTPVFGGLRLQAGFGQKTDTGEVKEASLWWSGKLAGDLQAAIGYSEERVGGAISKNETIGGSISWLSAFGLSLTAAYTQADGFTSAAKGDTFAGESTFWYGKVGFKFGQHAIAVHYGMHEDHAAAGDEGKSMGVGYVWNPIRWAEIYAAYHLFQLDRAAVSPEDVTVVALGTRIRF